MLNLENKKILIILGIIILIFIIFFGWIFLKDDNSLKENFVSKIIKKEIFTETEKEKTIEEKKQDFEKIKTENPNTETREIKKIEKENCAAVLDPELKSVCYEFIDFDQALEKKDIAVCRSLAKSLKDSCLYQVIAEGKDDFSVCQEIKDASLRGWCYQIGAITLNEAVYCDLAEDRKEICHEAMIAAQSYSQGIKTCEQLKSQQYFSLCVKNSRDACADMEGEEAQKRCESWRNFDYIISRGDKAYCDILPLENFKSVCVKYFDNGKKYLDSDNDGASDWEELYFGFNPSTADENMAEKIVELKKDVVLSSDVYADYQAKLYQLMLDADDDELSDYEEVEVHKTDINNPDTDGDGYSDGDETKSGHDPLNK